MINYIAHWDRILIQSRVEIINELQDYNFRAICPLGKSSKIKDHYSENIHWKISKTKFFDINGIFKLKRISSKKYIKISTDRIGNDNLYSLSSNKIRKELKWLPQTNLKNGLMQTIKWVEENLHILKKQPEKYIHKK